MQPQHQSALDQVLHALGGAIHGVGNAVFGTPIQSPVPERQQVQPMGRQGGLIQAIQQFAAQPKPVTQAPIPAPMTVQQKVTPTPYPGEEAFVRDMVAKTHGTPEEYQKLYVQAVTSPNWTGKYYGGAQPQQATPTPTPASALQQAVLAAKDAPLPTGVDKALAYIKSLTPKSVQNLADYYPALRDPGFMQSILQADQQKPGIGNVLLLQAFHESTLGRANNGNNIFGALPGGEGNAGAQFATPEDAFQYQVGPHMLGGGANPNMDVMDESGPLTSQRLVQLYKSYNPEGAYIQQILNALQ
jgi:hypothetical protein